MNKKKRKHTHKTKQKHTKTLKKKHFYHQAVLGGKSSEVKKLLQHRIH